MRRAFNFAFDFEEMNKQMFFGQYKRIEQLFRRHRARVAADCREGEELEILETVRDKVPPEVFTTPYTNPVDGSAEAVRNNLREAIAAAARGRLRGPRPASWSTPRPASR